MKPFAWAYQKARNCYWTFSETQEWPVGMAQEFGGKAIPLYRQPQPTLTELEREALWALASHGANDPAFAGFAKTLRGLLERTRDSHTTQGTGSKP